jgi:hypothetical protein
MSLNYFCPHISDRKVIFNFIIYFFRRAFPLQSLHWTARHQTSISTRFSHNILLLAMVNLYNESSSSCRQFSFDEMRGTQVHFPLPKLCEMFMHRVRHRLMLNLQKAVSMEKIHSSSWCSFVSKQLRISEAEELTDPYRWQETEHSDVICLFTSLYVCWS